MNFQKECIWICVCIWCYNVQTQNVPQFFILLVDANSSGCSSRKWTNSRRAKLKNHISVLCMFLHHGGTWASSQEHHSLQWAASPICSSQDRTQTQHPVSFSCSSKHRAGKPPSVPHPTVASNSQLLTWFYSHDTLVRKENFIPVVLETEPRIETRFVEYHLNTLPCLLFVSFDSIPAAVPKPSLKKSPLFPSFSLQDRHKKGQPTICAFECSTGLAEGVGF